MVTLSLECEAGHTFEGWYDSMDNYEVALQRGELCCPVCDSEFVMRRSSTRSMVGQALMSLARKIKDQGQLQSDQSGGLYFKVYLN
jgi:hypothetical protein